MKKHLIMAVLVSMPIASNASFLTRDLRNLLDILEEEERQMEERRTKWLEAAAAERKAIENAPKLEFEKQHNGVLMSVSNLETKATNVTYDNDGSRITFDSTEINIKQHTHARLPEKTVTLYIKNEIKLEAEKEEGSFSSHALSTSRQSYGVDRDLDFEKGHATYDASKKLFTLFIPYKETKTIAVEMVN